MITDTIRALIMEYYGYKTQVMEFIEMEHTPKKQPNKEEILRQIADLKAYYGIGKHYLESVLEI